MCNACLWNVAQCEYNVVLSYKYLSKEGLSVSPPNPNSPAAPDWMLLHSNTDYWTTHVKEHNSVNTRTVWLNRALKFLRLMQVVDMCGQIRPQRATFQSVVIKGQLGSIRGIKPNGECGACCCSAATQEKHSEEGETAEAHRTVFVIGKRILTMLLKISQYILMEWHLFLCYAAK